MKLGSDLSYLCSGDCLLKKMNDASLLAGSSHFFVDNDLLAKMPHLYGK